jgi:hypothetical protein
MFINTPKKEKRRRRRRRRRRGKGDLRETEKAHILHCTQQHNVTMKSFVFYLFSSSTTRKISTKKCNKESKRARGSDCQVPEITR